MQMKILDNSVSRESNSRPHRGSQVFKEGCSAVSGNHAVISAPLRLFWSFVRGCGAI